MRKCRAPRCLCVAFWRRLQERERIDPARLWVKTTWAPVAAQILLPSALLVTPRTPGTPGCDPRQEHENPRQGASEVAKRRHRGPFWGYRDLQSQESRDLSIHSILLDTTQLFSCGIQDTADSAVRSPDHRSSRRDRDHPAHADHLIHLPGVEVPSLVGADHVEVDLLPLR